MSTIKIRNFPIDVDIRSELEAYEWTRPRWTNDKLIAASPFRYDKTPSFFVTLEGDYAGAWSDSGYYDEEWKSGGFVKLLSFLRNETYEETEEYLLDSYGTGYHTDEITLTIPKLVIGGNRKPLNEDILEKYRFRHPYLERREIPEKIQRLYNVGYDRDRQAVVLPWYDVRGLANVKYRKTRGKVFWYYRDSDEKGGKPIRELVYGLNIVHQRNIKRAVLTEAEIDAQTWASEGVFGLATGGANFTDAQAEQIKRSPIERLLIAGDNDKAGRRFNEQVVAKLRGYIELEVVTEYPEGIKDANEARVNGKFMGIKSENVEILRNIIAK